MPYDGPGMFGAGPVECEPTHGDGARRLIRDTLVSRGVR